MNKVILNNSYTNNTLSILVQKNADCTCYGCSGCIGCVLFLPIVGALLGPLVSLDLIDVRN